MILLRADGLANIHLTEASLLAERIAFAEQTLKGAAEPIMEEEFLEYLSVQERDRLLEEQFITFLEESEALEEIVYPTVQDASQRFTSARIVVLEEDISVNPEFPFEFQIKDARLVDRAEDGSLIVFEKGLQISNNALKGQGIRYDLSRQNQYPIYRVTMDSVACLKCYEKEMQFLSSVLLNPFIQFASILELVEHLTYREEEEHD